MQSKVFKQRGKVKICVSTLLLAQFLLKIKVMTVAAKTNLKIGRTR